MVKVISLSNNAYSTLKALKQGEESFSDVVLRMNGKSHKKTLLDFYGKWPSSKEELNTIEKVLSSERKKFKTRNYVLS